MNQVCKSVEFVTFNGSRIICRRAPDNRPSISVFSKGIEYLAMGRDVQRVITTDAVSILPENPFANCPAYDLTPLDHHNIVMAFHQLKTKQKEDKPEKIVITITVEVK
jgi:hypothetical protein